MRKFLISFLLFFVGFNQTLAFENYFLFGLRLQDNEYELISRIENKFNVKVPVISLIYDDFSEGELIKLAKTFKTLGIDRVYHISVNPFGYNLKELIDSKNHMGWERKYRALFRLIKKYDVKVIFRSLHEMNGGWYSWSSDPYRYKIFWKMIWGWSREEGLDRSNILFDMSINSQDLPAVEGSEPSQTTPVVTCSQEIKIKTGCLTFEDYYPGDEFVDLLGITIYNWGEGARKEDWAKWRNPMKIIDEPGYNTFDRMKKIGKPIFIDEAGSTSVKLKGPYNELGLIDYFKEFHTSTGGVTATGTKVKNDWIKQLPELYTNPQVVGGAYFNADVTYGLNDRRQIGELDWTAIDPDKNFAYPAIIDLLNDYRNLEFPTFYFDLSKKILDSKKWINDDEMVAMHDLVSKFMVYTIGNIIINGDYMGGQQSQKYQYYLEKELSKDKNLCDYISTSFPKIQCGVDKSENQKEKKIAFDILRKRTEDSEIRLSNWGVWDQIEQLKLIVESKGRNALAGSKEASSQKAIIDYYNYYEKTFLDLR